MTSPPRPTVNSERFKVALDLLFCLAALTEDLTMPAASSPGPLGGDRVGDLSANRSPQGYYLSWLGYPGGGTYLDPWTLGGGTCLDEETVGKWRLRSYAAARLRGCTATRLRS